MTPALAAFLELHNALDSIVTVTRALRWPEKVCVKSEYTINALAQPNELRFMLHQDCAKAKFLLSSFEHYAALVAVDFPAEYLKGAIARAPKLSRTDFRIFDASVKSLKTALERNCVRVPGVIEV